MPSGVRKSAVTICLLLFKAAYNMGMLLASSPWGGSILMTVAPICCKISDVAGPGKLRDKSSTVMPSSKVGS